MFNSRVDYFFFKNVNKIVPVPIFDQAVSEQTSPRMPPIHSKTAKSRAFDPLGCKREPIECNTPAPAHTPSHTPTTIELPTPWNVPDYVRFYVQVQDMGQFVFALDIGGKPYSSMPAYLEHNEKLSIYQAVYDLVATEDAKESDHVAESQIEQLFHHPACAFIRSYVPWIATLMGWRYVAKGLHTARALYGRPPRAFHGVLYPTPEQWEANRQQTILMVAKKAYPKRRDVAYKVMTVEEYKALPEAQGANACEQERYFRYQKFMLCVYDTEGCQKMRGAVGFTPNVSLGGQRKVLQIIGIHSHGHRGEGVVALLMRRLMEMAEEGGSDAIYILNPEYHMVEIACTKYGALEICSWGYAYGIPTSHTNARGASVRELLAPFVSPIA